MLHNIDEAKKLIEKEAPVARIVSVRDFGQAWVFDLVSKDSGEDMDNSRVPVVYKDEMCVEWVFPPDQPWLLENSETH